jgi:nanoRNase/pAp phosphatase (c-di-AMP/oligoRNAs hydrolase)
MSKISNKCLDEEISFLRITIDHFAEENESIKQKIEDLKVTYQSDKELLNEYYNQISNKD